MLVTIDAISHQAADHGRDDGSFSAFFAENRTAALRQAQRLVMDTDTAEDIVAEAFARMWARWSGGAIDEPARYLSRIIRNAAMDHFRQRARERDGVAKAARAVDARGDSVTAMIESREMVAGLLAQVSPAQRRTVSLRYLSDLSEAQTAQYLGLSVGTVKSSTSRGLDRMRRLCEVDTAA